MSTLSKNIFYNLAGQGLLLILGFAAVRYVFTRLGPDALGLIYFTISISAVLSAVLELGICSTTTREVSAHFKDDRGYIRDLIRTASLFYWSAYALFAIGVYWLAPVLVTRWVHLRTLDPGMAAQVMRVLGIASLVGLPRAFYVSIIRGIQRMEFNNLIDVGSNALQQFGTILILALGGSLLHVAYWFATCLGLGIIVLFFVCAHFFSMRAMVPGFAHGVVKRNFGYTAKMAWISLLSMFHMQTDKAVVSKLLPLGVFGYYGLAYSTVSRGMVLTNAVSQAAFPSLSALFKAGDRVRLRCQYRKLQDLLCFGMVPVFAAVPFAAGPLFTHLLNAEAARMLLLPITFLCLGFFLNGTLNVAYVSSLAVGRPDIAARFNFYALFVVLPATIVLIHYFGLGGASFSWVFYQLVAYAYMVPRICLECLRIRPEEYYSHILRILGLASLTYGVAWKVLDTVGTRSIPSLALAYTLASLVFLIAAYRSIGEELRESFHRLPLMWQQGSHVLPS